MCLSFLRRRSALELVSVVDIARVTTPTLLDRSTPTDIAHLLLMKQPDRECSAHADADLEAINVADGEVVGRRQSSVIGSPLVLLISLPEVASPSSRRLPARYRPNARRGGSTDTRPHLTCRFWRRLGGSVGRRRTGGHDGICDPGRWRSLSTTPSRIRLHFSTPRCRHRIRSRRPCPA